MEATPSPHEIAIAGWVTELSRRAPVPTENSIVKVNKPTVKRMTLFRSSVVAMIRGVSCPLATWIATINELKVKTMNAIDEVITKSAIAIVCSLLLGANPGNHPRSN